ncbi:MAG TPA: hypothetical protein VFH10_09075 [Nocardioides sp.]|uniref:hypothetical protein n=1 Tax=Nocardioides sp. TaxID=35761 RepID=UPI002D7EF7EB|nr:hypothetical protein [Nocardioides sp.]HET6652779.1 hypothetical protein [Nocardioides sp.]
MSLRTIAGRSVALLATTLLIIGVAPAGAAYAPVEPYARYQPQSVCSPVAKAGTVALGRWLVRTHGGRFGTISRSCAGRSVSEHKEGRAFDWTLDVRRARDRASAARFLRAAFATGTSGEHAELARRMGIMYIIWNDRIYSSYRQFSAKPYLSPSCKRLSTCSRTLRHRDHMLISLTRAAAWGRTSWYAGRVPAS